MDHWQGVTYAKEIASGATIYVDRGDDPVLPPEGAIFAIDHVGGGREDATILATSAEAIVFSIGAARWLMAPASEAAPRFERDGRVFQAWLVIDAPSSTGSLPSA